MNKNNVRTVAQPKKSNIYNKINLCPKCYEERARDI